MSVFLSELHQRFSGQVLTGYEETKTYHHDMVSDYRLHQEPQAVVFPRSTEDVQDLMQLAARYRIPVTPRGGGSGLAGGAIAAPGGIICALERMDRILEIDRENLIARVEAGVITRDLENVLSETGVFFAGYPMSEEVCTLGGNVATNAGGGRAVKYGVTGDHVLGLTVVTAAGDVITLRGKRMKDVVGLDLMRLFVGSEGILGVITEITLRLTPRPAWRRTFGAIFPGASNAAAAIGMLRVATADPPSSIEYIDGETALAVAGDIWKNGGTLLTALRETLVSPGALLLIEVEGSTEEQQETRIQNYQNQLRSAGAVFPWIAEGDLWKLRKFIPWWIKRTSPSFHSNEDIVVPPARIPELVHGARELAKARGITIAIFGHGGDGNVHINPYKPPAMTPEMWHEQHPVFVTALYDLAVSLGGTISGEHGIGRKRTPHIASILTPPTIAAMQAVRLSMDPQGIMNPGVLLP